MPLERIGVEVWTNLGSEKLLLSMTVVPMLFIVRDLECFSGEHDRFVVELNVEFVPEQDRFRSDSASGTKNKSC